MSFLAFVLPHNNENVVDFYNDQQVGRHMLVNHKDNIQRTECVIDRPTGYNFAFIRIDYLTGLTLQAREWVSINGIGEIGRKGDAWWKSRFLVAPDNEAYALNLAKSLPPPHSLIIEHPKAGGIIFIEYTYPPETGKASVISGENSVFLADQDKVCLDLALVEPNIGTKWDSYAATPSWWDRTNLHFIPKQNRALENPFSRTGLSSEGRTLMESVLCASRATQRLNSTQAAKNLSIAYSLGVAATASEIKPFFNRIISIDDFILKDHLSTLYKKLTKKLQESWLDKLITPRLDFINCQPQTDRPSLAKALGIGLSGWIDTGMWWNSNGYMRGEIHVPAVSAEMVFLDDPLDKPTKESKKITDGEKLVSFFEFLKETLRDCINEVRVDLGVPKIGEGWINETLLYYRLKERLVDHEVIQHGKPKWLGRQHFDIWIPGLNVAVEYHGEQHFVANAFFGGEAAFRKNVERDARKRALAKANGVKIIELRFDNNITDTELLNEIQNLE